MLQCEIVLEFAHVGYSSLSLLISISHSISSMRIESSLVRREYAPLYVRT